MCDEMGELWTVKEVQARLHCGLTTVYDLVTAGQLRAVRLGNRKGLRIWSGSVDGLLLT